MAWDGIKRRSIDFIEPLSDHDKIIRMIEIQSNQINILEEHKKDFKEHKEEDNVSFKKVQDQIGRHAMFIYIGMGIIITLKFVFNH